MIKLRHLQLISEKSFLSKDAVEPDSHTTQSQSKFRWSLIPNPRDDAPLAFKFVLTLPVEIPEDKYRELTIERTYIVNFNVQELTRDNTLEAISKVWSLICYEFTDVISRYTMSSFVPQLDIPFDRLKLELNKQESRT